MPDAHFVNPSVAVTDPRARVRVSDSDTRRLWITWNADELDPEPPGVVTWSVPAPAPGGIVAVSCVGELTVTPVAAAPPTVSAVAPVRFVPVTVIWVPTLPDVGVNEVIVGGGLTAKFAVLLAEPFGVVTVIGPDTALAGTVAVIVVGEFTVNAAAGTPPNVTAVAPVRFVPVMTIGVPARTGGRGERRDRRAVRRDVEAPSEGDLAGVAGRVVEHNRFQAPLGTVPLKMASDEPYGGGGAGAGPVKAPPFVGRNVPGTIGVGTEFSEAWLKVMVALLTSVEPPVSASRTTFWPEGPTRRMSTSLGKVWLKPVIVAVTFVTAPVMPVTLIVEGYGVAGPWFRWPGS